MFVVAYADKAEIADAFESSAVALTYAEKMSRVTGHEITVLYNTSEGETHVCCRYRRGEQEIVGGYCLPESERGRRRG